MTGADNIRGGRSRWMCREAYRGKGRVILFANNPIYRWQNHGEFNMVFNSILNWNDLPGTAPIATVAAAPRERPAMIQCPWTVPAEKAAATPASNTTGNTPATPAGAAPAAPQQQRAGIPDCFPPGWTQPAQLAPYNAPAVPTDRPRPIVDDYLKYVVTAPPPAIVARFNLDTTFYKKFADANGYPILGLREGAGCSTGHRTRPGQLHAGAPARCA